MPRALLPILSCAQAARAERAFLRGDARRSLALMTKAAEGIRDEIVRQVGRPASVLVLAGKGHNGADAVLAAALLRAKEVTVVFAEGIPTAGQAAEIWRRHGAGMRVVLAQDLAKLRHRRFDVILDGLLGQGFRAPLRAPYAKLIAATDRLRGFRVAVDLPSGLGDGATGPAFRADLTVSIGALKRPLLAPAAEAFRGRLRVVDLDLPGAPGDEACATDHALDALREARPAGTEKRRQGKVLIVAGSDPMPGAALMNTAAALQAGAGLVTACVPRSILARAAVAYPEAMWQGLTTDADGTLAETPSAKAFAQKDVLLTGSGLGPGAVRLLPRMLTASTGDLVLDADALRPEILSVLPRRARAAPARRRVPPDRRARDDSLRGPGLCAPHARHRRAQGGRHRGDRRPPPRPYPLRRPGARARRLGRPPRRHRRRRAGAPTHARPRRLRCRRRRGGLARASGGSPHLSTGGRSGPHHGAPP